MSKKPKKDPYIWRNVGVTFHKKWNGDPRNFLQDCNWDVPTILTRLKEDSHLYNGRRVSDYPYLRGDKIGPLWLRMLRDNVGISKLKNLGKAPIPVDIHIARASLSMGVVRGQFRGNLEGLFEYIRKSWSESVKGLNATNGPMIALDLDEPLWHLSKYGCSSNRDRTTGFCSVFNKCEAKKYCIKGKIKIENGRVEVDT